jgi:ribulose-phosphate 3-epimerase
MSVNPGFGGQKFVPTSLDKLRRLKQMIDGRSLSTNIEIDGGIDLSNIAEIVAGGANIVVAGSAVFGGGTPTESVKELIENGTVWV